MTDAFQIDFLLLSLLFAVLYGISAAGFQRSQKEGSLASHGVRTEALKIASTIAFIGIFTSCSSAWVVRLYPAHNFALVAWPALSVQATLLTLWWYFERRGADVVDFETAAKRIEASHKNLVLLNAGKLGLTGRGTMSSLEEDALYSCSRESISKEWELYPKALYRIIPSAPGKITEATLETIMQSVFFSRDHFDALVVMLRKEHLLKELAPKTAPVPPTSLPTGQQTKGMWGPAGSGKTPRGAIDSK